MDFIQACAKEFNNCLREGLELDDLKAVDAKRMAFNACTVALIGVVALGILGALSLKVAVVLGAISLFGRVVVDQSLSDLSSLGNVAHRVSKWVDSDSMITFKGYVLFYT